MGCRSQNGGLILLLSLANMRVVLIIYTRHLSPPMFYRDSVDSESCMVGDRVGERTEAQTQAAPKSSWSSGQDGGTPSVRALTFPCTRVGKLHTVRVTPVVTRAGRFTHCFAWVAMGHYLRSPVLLVFGWQAEQRREGATQGAQRSALNWLWWHVLIVLVLER